MYLNGWIDNELLFCNLNDHGLDILCFCLSPRRRREKLQAHLKESRSLKNYTANPQNTLDAKSRNLNADLRMHEVITAVCFHSSCIPSLH